MILKMAYSPFILYLFRLRSLNSHQSSNWRFITDINPVEGEMIIKKIVLNSHLWSSKKNYFEKNIRQEHNIAVETDDAATN